MTSGDETNRAFDLAEFSASNLGRFLLNALAWVVRCLPTIERGLLGVNKLANYNRMLFELYQGRRTFQLDFCRVVTNTLGKDVMVHIGNLYTQDVWDKAEQLECSEEGPGQDPTCVDLAVFRGHSLGGLQAYTDLPNILPTLSFVQQSNLVGCPALALQKTTNCFRLVNWAKQVSTEEWKSLLEAGAKKSETLPVPLGPWVIKRKERRGPELFYPTLKWFRPYSGTLTEGLAGMSDKQPTGWRLRGITRFGGVD